MECFSRFYENIDLDLPITQPITANEKIEHVQIDFNKSEIFTWPIPIQSQFTA